MNTFAHPQTYAFIIGTDISKDSLDVCLSRVADKQLCYQKFNNNMQGFQKMKQWLKQYGCELETDTLFCMEHTGLYTRRLVHYLLSRQVAVWLETPLQIKRSIGLARGKDDKIDSERIVRYAFLHQDKAVLVNLSGLTIEKLKDLQANRNRLKKALSSIKTTVKEMLSVDETSGKTLQRINKEAIKGLEKSLEQVEQKMSEFIEQDEALKKKYDLVTSIKGVGKVLAITLLVYTHGFTKIVFVAEQNALVALNAERYYRAMVSSQTESWNIRDRHMVQTLKRLLDFHGPSSKAIIWEHNTHVGDARYTVMAREGMVNVGQLVRKEYGEEKVFAVGFGSYSGTVIAADEWGAPLKKMQVPPATQGSWEQMLHALSSENKIILSKDMRENKTLKKAIGHRAIGVVYNPKVEHLGNYVPSTISKRYDAFLYIDQTQALHPIEIPVSNEPPDLYPSGT